MNYRTVFVLLLLPFFLLPLVHCSPLAPLTPGKMKFNNLKERELHMSAAERGNPDAQFIVGKTYCCGFGSDFSYQKTYHWWCKAGRAGHATSQYHLGRLFHGKEHRLIPKSFIEAHMWYSLAADQKHPRAIRGLQDITPLLTPQQLATSQQLKDTLFDEGCMEAG